MKLYETPLRVALSPELNATDLLLKRLTKTPDSTLFRLPVSGQWQNISTKEFYERVIALSKGFIASGVQAGDKVALMCSPRFEWTLIDFALWFSGAVCVPIYETSSPAQIQWIMNNSQATRVIVEHSEMFSRFDEVYPDLPHVQSVWNIDLGDLNKLNAAGTQVKDTEVEARRTMAKGSDIATLIYTSGSTGMPKGCVLSHSNFVDLCLNAELEFSEILNPPDGASTLFFITIAHVFARFASIMCVTAGVAVGHEPDTKNLLSTLKVFKPTFIFAVPRVFEKIYNVSEQKAHASKKGKIFDAASRVAQEYSQATENSGSASFSLKMRYKFFDVLVYSKIRSALGGRTQYALSGGASLNPDLTHFFRGVGLTVLDGWGLTESTAPVTLNRPNNFKVGTVGQPMPGLQIRIADDGEVLAKGLNIFSAYWNNPEETKQAFGGKWFKTGDLGHIDDEGFLTLSGRKKEIIITSSAKNISPAFLEGHLTTHPLISQVVIVGENKPFIAALITLDESMLPVWLKTHHLDPHMSISKAAINERVLHEIQAAIDKVNTHVSRAESIRKFVILTEDFSQEKGSLTPKLTPKRAVILKEYAADIELLYTNGQPA